MQKTSNNINGLQSFGLQRQGKIYPPTTIGTYKIQIFKEQGSEAEYLRCLIAEVNNVAVDLYKMTEYAIASKMLKTSLTTITNIITPGQQDSSRKRNNDATNNLLRLIVSGKKKISFKEYFVTKFSIRQNGYVFLTKLTLQQICISF